jgi:predicted XRE-type DNA-binding protein
MATLNHHWTERSIDAFLYRISTDFVGQIERFMETDGVKQSELATMLGVSKGRVSQMLNNPGNLTLRKVVEYARALGKKVAIVPYDDTDSGNQNGPIDSEIFTICWERAGKPKDFFAVHASMAKAANIRVAIEQRGVYQFSGPSGNDFYMEENGILGSGSAAHNTVNPPEIRRLNG